ncbi:MAG TPA: dihydroorotate dehydrogenase-like protein [Vicinamibacterales bacterium]
MRTATTYLGMRLDHPFVAGASPLGYRLDTVKRLEDAGCAAVVLHSLFEEQITYEEEGRVAGLDALDPGFEDVFSYFPSAGEYPLRPGEYAEHIRRLKESVRIPIIASLNGRTKESWLKFAKTLEEAGADALELNMYQVVTDLDVPGTHVESQLLGVVQELKRLVRIPIAVKLSPWFTAFGHVARRLDEAGADALVLFNRFYQPDIDIRTREPLPQAELSTSAELLLRLRWTAILHGRVRASIAVTGGIATPADGIKALLAGADAVQVVSAILRHGPAYMATLRAALEDWLAWSGAESLDEVKGAASLSKTSRPGAFERAHYIRTLHSWTR